VFGQDTLSAPMLPTKAICARGNFAPKRLSNEKFGLFLPKLLRHDATMTQETTRYSRTAMLLHWAIALLLVFNFALGERTEDLRQGPELFWVMQLHKSIGITVLLLSVWRLLLRLVTTRPAKAADGPVLQLASSAVHWGFYAVMIIVPLSGWVLVSTAKVQLPTLLFGSIPWPHLPNWGHDAHEAAEEIHEILAKAMLPLIALHIIGAVRHQFLLKDALVERMVPARRVSMIGFVLLLASLALAFVAGLRWPAPTTAKPGVPLPDFRAAQAPRAPVVPPKAAAVVADAAPVTPASQAVPHWRVVPGGQLGFRVRVNGEAVQGHFDDWTADIQFDPARLDQSKLRATIDLSSVNSGDAGRDEMLRGADFFGADQTTARFTATRFRAQGGNRFQAEGALRLKGVSRPVSLAFSLDIQGDAAKAQGTAQLDRRAFGVGTGQFAGTDSIAANVDVTFAFAAKRQTAAS
jgi:cytochrome b561/polyisoprenoid-binding protein YceI